MSGARVERLAILGLGLLGGSVALAARRAGVVGTIAASGRRRGPLVAARDRGMVDEIGSPREVVRNADLVLLAAPVGAMPSLLEEVVSDLGTGTLVSDVGSVKAPLAETLPGLLPSGVEFIGSHPMAGSHLKGAEHARADLFRGAPCVVCPTPGVTPAAVERLAGFWRALGARVLVREPHRHDLEVAWVSHVPHILAFAFARALEEAPGSAGALAGPGFRDFTRIARSEPELWAEIATLNRKAISAPLARVLECLGELGRALEDGDADLLAALFARGREGLARLGAEETGSAASSTEAAEKPDPGARPGNPAAAESAATQGANDIVHE